MKRNNYKKKNKTTKKLIRKNGIEETIFIMNDGELKKKKKRKQRLVTKISISYFVFIVFLSVSLIVCYKYDCIISLFGFSSANFQIIQYAFE